MQQLLITTLTITYIGMQLSLFVTMRYNMTLFIKIMSAVCPFILITIKYCIFILKAKSIQNLHYLIREDWKIIRNKLEIKIILEYAHCSRISAIVLFLFADFVVIVIAIVQFLPNILDVVLPLDEPRPRKLLVAAKYFVSQDKYFLTKAFHEIVIIVICALIVFATASQMLVFCCHSFGMFKIASHRIEYSIENSVFHIPNPEKEYAIYKRIMHAVVAHRRAMEFSNIFVSSFNVPYCFIAVIGVISLSINLYGFVEAATISKNMTNLLFCFLMTLVHLVYMFVANYLGQKIVDYNNELFRLIYSTSWYLMPVSSQKLILFFMLKTGKDFYFTFGIIFVAKMETFAALVNAALSYVAVMYSRVY
ncbi:uncharacterized protein LOC112454742 isoform X2 [Temnothorax curvispinosus]|uniref:Odorant receptor n=1 Tax=Temnothorax curvispinosus TaxID=300111 RepID=A0A6J1PSX9_9HYME|nr:uncharacterized protein LOC112454742 isoform X2 [Temnothorax curvispinosus]